MRQKRCHLLLRHTNNVMLRLWMQLKKSTGLQRNPGGFKDNYIQATMAKQTVDHTSMEAFKEYCADKWIQLMKHPQLFVGAHNQLERDCYNEMHTRLRRCGTVKDDHERQKKKKEILNAQDDEELKRVSEETEDRKKRAVRTARWAQVYFP